jgi:hypothetical protein
MLFELMSCKPQICFYLHHTLSTLNTGIYLFRNRVSLWTRLFSLILPALASQVLSRCNFSLGRWEQVGI